MQREIKFSNIPCLLQNNQVTRLLNCGQQIKEVVIGTCTKNDKGGTNEEMESHSSSSSYEDMT